MNRLLVARRAKFLLVILAFAWNILLLTGVVFNFEFAHSRAAGGRYTDFPSTIRVIYLFQLALVIYQVRVFTKLFKGKPMRHQWIPKFFFAIGILGILLNAASKSSNERWNVIPAAIICWAFWKYGLRKNKSGL